MDRAREIIVPPEIEEARGSPARVAIAIPSGDHVHANFAMAFAALTYYSGIRRQPIALVSAKGSLVAKNRDNAVRIARQYACDWLLFLDSDLTFPPQALEKLLAHGRDIVGATYPRRSVPHDNLAKPKDEQAVTVSGLVEVDALPTGCLLIRMSVFDRMQAPYFRCGAVLDGEVWRGITGPATTGEDYNFCIAARELDLSIWLDVELSYELVHWGEIGFRLAEGDVANAPRYETVELDL